jgi:hypothetical protein
MSQAIMYKAQECYEILQDYIDSHLQDTKIDYGNLFARTMTIYNFTHWKDMKEQRVNTDMLQILNRANFKRQRGREEVLRDCEKVLMSLIISRQIDEKTKEIFRETFGHYKAIVSMIPAFLVKACFLF